jgi:dCMP deaminase
MSLQQILDANEAFLARKQKWHDRYIEMAKLVSTWSKDRTHVGSVAVDADGRILSVGYNGFSRGIADTEERLVDRNVKLAYTVHSELNCVLNAAHSGVSLKNASLYVYGLPVCSECAKAVIQSGVREVYMCSPARDIGPWQESFELTKSMFDETHVKWQLWNDTSSSSEPTLPTLPALWLEDQEKAAPSTSSSDGQTLSESSGSRLSTRPHVVGK